MTTKIVTPKGAPAKAVIKDASMVKQKENIQEAVVIVINKASGSPAPRRRYVVLSCHLSIRTIAVTSEQACGTEGRARVDILDSVIVVIADVPCPNTA